MPVDNDFSDFAASAYKLREEMTRKPTAFSAPDGLDAEQELMAVIVYHLGTLTPRARRRVIAYVESRLEESEDA